MLFLLIGSRRINVLTLDEAARVLGTSKDYVRNLRYRRKLKTFHHNGRHYYEAFSVHNYRAAHPKCGQSLKAAS